MTLSSEAQRLLELIPAEAIDALEFANDRDRAAISAMSERGA